MFNILCVLCCVVVCVGGLRNGLLKTPPMGWLSWEKFGCQISCKTDAEAETCISERLFLQIATSLVERGFRDAGYDRINIDDCWMAKYRDPETGDLQPDPLRFPNGMSALVDQIHDQGFKVGIYQNMGKKTCMGYPGALDHIEKDAAKFAEWKFDMVKMDACFSPPEDLDKGFGEFSRHLLKTGHKIALSCSLSYYQLFVSRRRIVPNWRRISSLCNIFRVYHDIHATWESVLATIDFMADNQAIFRSIAGPGKWPDPDMLMIGNPGLSVPEAESQMAIWCILPAPLFMSNDPRDISKEYLSILLNTQAIAINQDEDGHPGERVFHNRTLDIWRRRLSGRRIALVIMNRYKTKPIHLKVPFSQLVFDDLRNVSAFEMFDVFRADKRALDASGALDVRVQGHGVAFLVLKPQ